MAFDFTSIIQSISFWKKYKYTAVLASIVRLSTARAEVLRSEIEPCEFKNNRSQNQTSAIIFFLNSFPYLRCRRNRLSSSTFFFI